MKTDIGSDPPGCLCSNGAYRHDACPVCVALSRAATLEVGPHPVVPTPLRARLMLHSGPAHAGATLSFDAPVPPERLREHPLVRDLLAAGWAFSSPQGSLCGEVWYLEPPDDAG